MSQPISLMLLFLFSCSSLMAQEVLEDRNFIRIDQFGYMPEASKVAVIAQAVDGYNAGNGLAINPGEKIEVINTATNAVVFSDYAKVWNGGSVDGLSGDRGVWFDFTALKTAGDYRIRLTKLDGSVAESYDFRIADDVYHVVLRKAVNFFYYQRFNQEKTAEFASGEPWTDAAWFDRPNQEEAVKELDNPSSTRDLSGGWLDAGDPNKYVTFAVEPVHALLATYDNNPGFWNTFDLEIPESGNDTPDLLDEIKFEIDWIKRMQLYDPNQPTGGIIQKMGILNDGAYVSPPSTDTRERWHNGVCVSSSITGAGMMAHAALTYRRAGVWPEEVTELTDRAIKAWNYYEQSPNKSERCDDGRIEAGDADGPGDQYAIEHLALAAAAAVYLFELTGEQKYNDFVKANFREARPWQATDWGVYRAHQGEALLYYTNLPNADNTTSQQIIAKKTAADKSEGANYKLAERDNLYRAKPIYFNWGSNSLISRHASDVQDFLLYNLKPDNHDAYTERAQSIINYLHGTNPSGICHLSNMYRYGGDLCADEMWHSWFNLGSRFDNIDGSNVGPAPGFISGGPNPQGQASMPIKLGTHTFSARAGEQPDQKAFSVDNNWQNGPWAYNEPAIYYQAAYIKALSFFATGLAPAGRTGEGLGAINDCSDAEADFSVASDVGNNGTVEEDANTTGSSGGSAIALFDAGDAATVNFSVIQAGRFDVAVRVRVGEAAGTETNLADQYTLSLDGNELAYTLDLTSVSGLEGATYWGEIVLVNASLSAGEHTLTVTANNDWLKLDRVCWRDPNSVPEPPDTGGDFCLEAEAAFTVVDDAGENGGIRVDDFTPGASGGQYLNMFDVGDEVSIVIELDEAGATDLRFRLRVGEASGTETNLADKYIISVDGSTISTVLDETTISGLEGDTYWGEIIAENLDLSLGNHTVNIRSNNSWLKFDRLCVVPQGGGSSEISFDCQEVESVFEVVTDVGTNSTVRSDNFTPGASGDSYINLFDAGDEAKIEFEITNGGKHEIRLRLRVGEAAGTTNNLITEYSITVDGEILSTVLDESTVSTLQDDTYWGELVGTVENLSIGTHTLSVRADRDWLKFDRFCFGNADATSLFGGESFVRINLQLNPNPNNGDFTLQLSSPTPIQLTEATLYNLAGGVVATTTLTDLPARETNLELRYQNLDLPAGVYLLRLKSNNTQVGAVQRVMILD